MDAVRQHVAGYGFAAIVAYVNVDHSGSFEALDFLYYIGLRAHHRPVSDWAFAEGITFLQDGICTVRVAVG